MNVLGTNPPKQTKRNEIGLQEFHTHASQPAILMTPIKKRLKSESDWFSSYCSTRGTLTHGGPLLAFSPRTVGVEDPDDFVKAAVELRAVRRETQRMGRCQLIQVVVGSKRCSEVPIKSVPYVDGVVSATAGNAEEKRKETGIYCKISKLSQTKSIVLGKTRDCNIRLDSQNGVLSNSQHKRPIHNR